MELVEVTARHRNDFRWKGRCRQCGHIEHYGDGYADALYCQKVVPNRYCPKCGLNCYGKAYPAETGASPSPGITSESSIHNDGGRL